MLYKKNMSCFFTLLTCMLSGWLISACHSDSYVKVEGMIWNTTYHITFRGNPGLRDSILATLNDVGKSLNVFDKSSVVSRVNDADSMIIDQRFAKVYEASRKVNIASAGMFDPTLSPLISAWGFGPGHRMSADTVAIDSILSFVGLQKTRLNGNFLVKDDRRTQFNFSAIAKGFGCDEVAALLKRNGVSDFLVEIGGELALSGESPRGGGWLVSIDMPILSDSTEIHDSCEIIEITDAGMATSGNYRNFRKEDGKTFGHTISPLTGRPVSTDVISATVIAPSAMEADAVATACMASGSVKSKSMLQNLRLEGMLILSDSSIWMSDGFSNHLRSLGAWK